MPSSIYNCYINASPIDKFETRSVLFTLPAAYEDGFKEECVFKPNTTPEMSYAVFNTYKFFLFFLYLSS